MELKHRGRKWAVVLLSMALLVAGTAWGNNGGRTAPGQRLFTGGGSLLFKPEDGAGALGNVLIMLFEAWAQQDDEYYYPEEETDYFNTPIASFQVDTGLSYFIAPGLALGGKLMFQDEDDNPQYHTLMGAGPEITYFFDVGGGRFIPFVGAGAYYARGMGIDEDPDRARWQYRGTAAVFKTGIYSAYLQNMGWSFQFSYQVNRLKEEVFLEADVRRRIGLGLSLTSAF
jgi:hypothetical protein